MDWGFRSILFAKKKASKILQCDNLFNEQISSNKYCTLIFVLLWAQQQPCTDLEFSMRLQESSSQQQACCELRMPGKYLFVVTTTLWLGGLGTHFWSQVAQFRIEWKAKVIYIKSGLGLQPWGRGRFTLFILSGFQAVLPSSSLALARLSMCSTIVQFGFTLNSCHHIFSSENLPNVQLSTSVTRWWGERPAVLPVGGVTCFATPTSQACPNPNTYFNCLKRRRTPNRSE